MGAIGHLVRQTSAIACEGSVCPSHIRKKKERKKYGRRDSLTSPRTKTVVDAACTDYEQLTQVNQFKRRLMTVYKCKAMHFAQNATSGSVQRSNCKREHFFHKMFQCNHVVCPFTLLGNVKMRYY